MKKKILVVDNHPLILEFISDLLEREGHDVDTAEDGISALKILTSFTPDIMFIDLIMPHISGDKLCQIVRNMQHLNDCYLVIISAVIAEQDLDYLKVDADAYIAKGSYSKMGENILAIVNELDLNRRGIREKPIIGLDDVHARQMTKELLSQSYHLKIILENMSEGILEVYSERIVYANSAAVSLLGLDQEKLLGSYPLDLFDKFEGQCLEALLKSGTDKPSEIGLYMPVKINGRLVTMKKFPLKEEESTTIIMIIDVSEQKRAEEEKRKLEAQLQRAQKMEAIGTLAGGVAHDLNNVLSGLVSYPELILMDLPEDSHLRKPILTIQKSGEKATAIVQDLLTLARRGITITEVVNLNDSISDCG
ncbi:MAG: response regulator [Deltaproteobacteria bacterium]|nr:response regulator [Deltaproteobacteria bacterium]